MVMDHCKKCGIPIQEFRTGRKKIAGELYCKRCYYSELGNFMDDHPIGIPVLKKV
jgi:uncharacterized Zn finger protein (UPF0148 family)